MSAIDNKGTPGLKAKLAIIGPVLFIWVTVMAVNMVKWLPVLLRGDMPGNDDYMRLVTVRDWLGGQGWADPTQARLFPPDPLQSHWARLNDMLIGGTIKITEPLFGPASAELAALIIVPGALLLIMLFLVTSLARQLSNSSWITLTSALMAALCFPILTQYSPGRIDHHGLQIVLALGTALCLIKADKARHYSAIAGLLCALSLWVGIESAPYVAAACITIGMMWVLGHETAVQNLRYFAASLLSITLFLLITSRPAAQWFAPACDALSSVYLVLCGAIAAAFLACSFAKLRMPAARLGLIAALGLGSLAVTIAVFPQCLKGPYAELDPRLAEIWLANVAEAKPFLTFLKIDPVVAVTLITIPILGLITVAIGLKDRGFKAVLIENRPLRVIIIFVAVNLAASLFQIRLMTFAGACAAPLAALLMAEALDWSEKFTSDVKRAFIRAGIIMGLSPLTLPLIVLAFVPAKTNNLTPLNETTNNASSPQAKQSSLITPITCRSAATLAPLNILPAGFAISQIDLGAPILATTHHSVSSAPYHRNEAGNIAALDVFMGEPNQAKLRLEQLGADYLIACRHYPETQLLTRLAPNGLLAKLKAGDAPEWLEAVTFTGRDQAHTQQHLLVYKVTLNKR